MLFVEYPKCSTCQKAKKWLTGKRAQFTARHIVEVLFFFDFYVYLQVSGMLEIEIQMLVEHVKQFIVDDLKNGDGKFEYMKIDVGKQAMNGREEDFEGIEFSASAFKNGSTIYVYPTYEFTEDKKPCGNDSFSFLLGEAIRPYKFGGTLWYKNSKMNDWEVSGNLVANNQQLFGASFFVCQLETKKTKKNKTQKKKNKTKPKIPEASWEHQILQ